jgi:glyoxylase-like metal-dependent hydrolase (beta-lactamase superfamily II)
MSANPAGRLPSGITVLGTRQFEAWQHRVLPPPERLKAGIWSIPVPIPDNPLRYTLSYLVPGDDGLVVVDPGWNTEETWDALVAGLAEAGTTPADITGVLATHVHPDHHGLSGRLREESGAWIAMHPAERDSLPHRLAAKDTGGHADPAVAMTAWLRRSGASDDEIADLFRSFGDRPGRSGEPAMADPDVLLEDGDLVPLAGRKLQAVWTPGHTPGHLCFAEPEAQVLLTGDHVLPRITPNIGLHPAAIGSPLASFLESLGNIEGYDDHDVLPAHEYRFRGLGNRIKQLKEHHEERCAEILEIVERFEDPTPWQVAISLTWSRPWAEIGRMRFGALSETAAHLDYLVRRGDLAWQDGNPTRCVLPRRAS